MEKLLFLHGTQIINENTYIQGSSKGVKSAEEIFGEEANVRKVGFVMINVSGT